MLICIHVNFRHQHILWLQGRKIAKHDWSCLIVQIICDLWPIDYVSPHFLKGWFEYLLVTTCVSMKCYQIVSHLLNDKQKAIRILSALHCYSVVESEICDNVWMYTAQIALLPRVLTLICSLCHFRWNNWKYHNYVLTNAPTKGSIWPERSPKCYTFSIYYCLNFVLHVGANAEIKELFCIQEQSLMFTSCNTSRRSLRRSTWRQH